MSNAFCLHLRGLPFRCNEGEIVNFLEVDPSTVESVEISKGADGRPSGDGFVTLNCPDAMGIAVRKHKQTMDGYNRYVEIFETGKGGRRIWGE